MRTLRLAEAVAQAEKLRLQAMAGRMATRAAFGAGAALFAILALAGFDAAIVVALIRPVGPVWACVIVAGGNLVIAAVLGLLAKRDSPSLAERSALQLRRDAWLAVKRDLAFTGLLSTAMTVWRRSRR